MSSDELRDKAKELLNQLLPRVHPDFVDQFVDLMVEAAAAEIREKYMVDVPNTGYYGIVVKKEP